MKRHKRISIYERSIMGALLARSAWFPSLSIAGLRMVSFKIGNIGLDDFAERATVMLGFQWHHSNASIFSDGCAAVGERVMSLAPSPCCEWLDQNVPGLWLVSHDWKIDAGWRRPEARVWFQSEEDATLFALSGHDR